MAVEKKSGPASGTAFKQFQHREQNHQGMLLWQSRLQEKLLKEQREKKKLALEQQMKSIKIDHSDQQDEETSTDIKSTLHFPKISSVSFNLNQNLGTIMRVEPQEQEGQYPVAEYLKNPTISMLPTPAGPIPNQYFPGGCGAPRRSPSGKLLTNLQGHIDIRYHQKDTRGFDQSIRYLEDKEKILNYKQDLDKQVEEKKRREREQPYFVHHHRQKLPSKITSIKSEESDDGIELAPLLRTKVYSKSLPKLDNHYLSSTDVTSTFNFSPRRMHQFYYTPQPETLRTSERESGNSSASRHGHSMENHYASILRQQTNRKVKQLETEKTFETVANEQHFNTWDSFWGRPGHGAPINYYSEEQHKKGNLWKLLHSFNKQ